ncbi:MAG: bifunctional hydroxymethylpyrimidine kinase/phosphomethylpyrimidine kinase [Pseudomonadota bacterium]
MHGRTLLIGELITNSGSGLQGDIITTTALGGSPLMAITQMSTGHTPLKRALQPVDPQFVSQQISASLDSPGVDSIKIGILPSQEIIDVVIHCLSTTFQDIPIVMCPITVSDLGEALIDAPCIKKITDKLFKHLIVLVLSVREAELLSGEDITDLESMCEIAHKLLKYGSQAILITGGILTGDNHYDVFVTAKSKEKVLSHRKSQNQIEEKYNFCGSWVLATAIATRLGQGYNLTQALNHSRQYVNNAILNAETNGNDYQNLNLIHSITPFAANETNSAYSILSNKTP